MGANADELSAKIGHIKNVAARIDDAWASDECVYPGHVDTLHRLVVELYEMTDRKPAFDGHKVVSCVAVDEFTKVLDKADDALEKGNGGQWHLEQLVGAGWKLTDAADKNEVVR